MTVSTDCWYPPGTCPRSTQALSRLLADAGLRQRLGAAGRTLIREAFSPDTMVAGNLAVYRELVPA